MRESLSEGKNGTRRKTNVNKLTVTPYQDFYLQANLLISWNYYGELHFE